MSKDEVLELALEALESNRRKHHYCEDTWYSCPKHEDGCANDSESDECNCGADKANAEIDQAITAIKAALEAKDDKRTQIEPWAIREEQVCPNKVCWHPYHCENGRCVEAENNVFFSKVYQKEKNRG